MTNFDKLIDEKTKLYEGIINNNPNNTKAQEPDPRKTVGASPIPSNGGQPAPKPTPTPSQGMEPGQADALNLNTVNTTNGQPDQPNAVPEKDVNGQPVAELDANGQPVQPEVDANGQPVQTAQPAQPSQPVALSPEAQKAMDIIDGYVIDPNLGPEIQAEIQRRSAQ